MITNHSSSLLPFLLLLLVPFLLPFFGVSSRMFITVKAPTNNKTTKRIVLILKADWVYSSGISSIGSKEERCDVFDLFFRIYEVLMLLKTLDFLYILLDVYEDGLSYSLIYYLICSYFFYYLNSSYFF